MSGTSRSRLLRNAIGAAILAFGLSEDAVHGASLTAAAGDDTKTIQAAIIAGETNVGPGIPPPVVTLDRPNQVSHIEITAGLRLECHGYEFGPASGGSGATSLVDLLGDFNILTDCTFQTGRNPNYQSALHWYTPDVAAHYPGFNKLNGLYTYYCALCLAVGALPAQYDHAAPPEWGLGAGGTRLSSPLAVDAPVSESAITRWLTYGALNPLWMAQTNGKLTVSDSALIAATNEWTGEDHAAVIAVRMRASSTVLISASSIENQDAAGAGRLLDLWDQSQVYLDSDILESYAPIWLQDNAALYMSNIADFGFNTTSSPFRVDGSWSGALVIARSQPFRITAVEAAPANSFLEATAGFSGPPAPNLDGVAQFDSLTILNPGYRNSAALYVPLCRNVRCFATNSYLVTTDPRTGLAVSRYLFSDGPDLFAGQIDQTAATIAPYPGTAAALGGWTFSNSGGGARWGSVASGLPAIADQPVTAAIALNGGAAGGAAIITSGQIAISPLKLYTLRAFLKSDGSASAFQVTEQYFGAGGKPLGSDMVFSGANATFPATWSPAMFILSKPCARAASHPCMPAGTTKVAIALAQHDAHAMLILNPSLR